VIRLVDLQIQVTEEGRDLLEPAYLSKLSGGLVLRAARSMVLKANEITRVPVGFAISLPDEVGAQIQCHRPAGEQHGFYVLSEMLGADDRDPIEVGVTFSDRAHTEYWMTRGDAVAELTFVPLLRVKLHHVVKLPDPPGKPRRPAFTDQSEFGA
jgi:dUTP pyrophosphatase